MQAITRLPQEVILNITSNLEHSDAQGCQFISRQWYNACHIKFLSTVKLTGENILRFIDSIDSNPRQDYLRAVSHIEMNVGAVDYVLTREQLKKIFLRFPDLSSVSISCHKINFIRRMDFNFCEAFNKDCLKQFDIFVQLKHRRFYFNRIRNMRQIITTIDLESIQYNGNDTAFTDYICGFERLTCVHKNTHLLQNIAAWIPVLTKFNTIKRISFGNEDDNVSFLHTYLRRNRQVALSTLEAAFARIEELIICTNYDYCSNSLLFAVELFDNLETVSITINEVDEWEQDHTLFFYENAFALLCKSKNGGKICFNDINDFNKHLPHAFEYIFGQHQTTSTTVLRVFMLEEGNQSLAPDLTSSIENGVKTVEISGISRFAFLHDLVLRYETSLAGLDVFEFQVHPFLVDYVDGYDTKHILEDMLANFFSPKTRIVAKFPPSFL